MNTQLAKQKRGFGWWLKVLALFLVILAVTTLGTGAYLRSSLLKRYPAPGRLVDVGGYKMHIDCTGQGSPTVILAAGLDDFSTMWALVQPEVAQATRVCSYDRAGLGWSEPGTSPRTSQTMVKELHTLLVNAQEAGPYVLAGHSFGGALVRLYANNYPDEVAGLVLVDAAPDDLFDRIPGWRNAIRRKLELYRSLEPLSSFGLMAFTPNSVPNRGMPEDMLARYRAVVVSTGYLRIGVAENEAFEQNLAEIRAANVHLGDLPLRVVSRGYWDTIPGFSDSENRHAWQIWQAMQSELASLSTQSRQIIAEESEHAIQLQQPELVVDAINEVVEIVH